MKCKVETVTPTKAKQLLEKNTGNFRKLDEDRVNRYANDMASGNWNENGESVKLNGSVLLDGQHRLSAIVKSGVPIKTVIVTDIECDSMNIDRGKPRTVAQWMRHLEFKNPNNVAAISRLCLAHEKGDWGKSSISVDITDAEIVKFAKQHQDIIQSGIHCSASVYQKIKINLSQFAVILIEGSGRKDPSENETAEWFCDKMKTGDALTETDSVLHLRNRILSATRNRPFGGYMKRMMLTLAWNNTVQGRPCKKLALKLTGKNAGTPPSVIEVAS